MANYNILTDYEKQRKLQEIEAECQRVNNGKYWVLKRLGIPKSTYYDWLKTGGITKSKAPKTVWNKTSETIENIIIKIRDDMSIYRSERSYLGIANNLGGRGIFITKNGVWSVLKRHGKNRQFSEAKKIFIIYPRSQRFLDVVCIDDIGLTNKKPRELSVFNAIDEYSQESVAILFVCHRINRYDVIELLAQIKRRYGRYPKIVRLDNAQAHRSIAAKEFCRQNNIELQFIDKGTPQQNWPVESFNGVLQKDLFNSQLWGGWNDLNNKQEILEDYAEYYNTKKPLDSDPLKRTPQEIATGRTSPLTQQRLKIKLLRKHRGQVAAWQEIIKNIQQTAVITESLLQPACHLSEMCVN
jgi:transposase InsO family protein